MDPNKEKIHVEIINDCPMLDRRVGMELMDRLERHHQLSSARAAIVKTIIQQPNLLRSLPSLDPETLLHVALKQEFPDLPDSVRQRVDNGPKPVRSESEPYGLSTLTPQQKEWVETDIAMMFRMKLLFLVSEASKPDWRAKTLYFMEQPQDPREYRSPEDVAKYEFMSVWRTDAWKRFQEQHGMLLTSFEQGAFGHAKPKPTTVGHNIDGIEQLHGAKTQRDPLQADGWVHKSLSERMAESSTWSEWAPGVKEALLEGILCQLDEAIVEECKDVKVRLASRATADVMDAVARVYSQVRSLGFPVLRFHADRAREFTSKTLQRWCHHRGIVATYTTGSDWKQSGRAEGEVNLIKRHSKILMFPFLKGVFGAALLLAVFAFGLFSFCLLTAFMASIAFMAFIAFMASLLQRAGN
eukprot:s1529_g11.t1